jgi:hypothetical protein
MRSFVVPRRAPAAALLVAASIVSTLWAGELPSDFVERYAPAAARLEQAYGHATVRGNYSLSYPRNKQARHGPDGLARTLSFTLESKGADISLAERNAYDYSDGREHDRIPRDWQLTTEWARFRDGGGPWEVLDLTDGRSYVDHVTGVRLSYGPGLLELLRQPIYTIDRVEDVVDVDRPIVRVTCHWDADGGTPLRNTGVYDFSPGESWALRHYINAWRGTRGDEPGRYELTLDYEGQRNGIPLLRRAEETFAHGPHFDPEQRTVVNITEIELATPPAARP